MIPNMADSAGGTNYYEVLEVPEDAPSHEVHKAYTRAKATYSSENPALYSMFSPEEARELLRLIEEAYTVLGNPSLRKAYDEARARGEKSPQVSLHTPSVASAPSPSLHQQHASPTQMMSTAQVQSEHRKLPDFANPLLPLVELLRCHKSKASNDFGAVSSRRRGRPGEAIRGPTAPAVLSGPT